MAALRGPRKVDRSGELGGRSALINPDGMKEFRTSTPRLLDVIVRKDRDRTDLDGSGSREGAAAGRRSEWITGVWTVDELEARTGVV